MSANQMKTGNLFWDCTPYGAHSSGYLKELEAIAIQMSPADAYWFLREQTNFDNGTVFVWVLWLTDKHRSI